MGRGPLHFDCWGLVWHVQRQVFARVVEEYQVHPDLKREVAALLDMATNSGDWLKLAEPVEGCAVGMAKNSKLHHVGVYTDAEGGFIIHADKPAVMAQTISRLRFEGWKRIEFYWHKSWPPPRTSSS